MMMMGGMRGEAWVFVIVGWNGGPLILSMCRVRFLEALHFFLSQNDLYNPSLLTPTVILMGSF